MQVDLCLSHVHCSVSIPDLVGAAADVMAIATPHNLILLSRSHKLLSTKPNQNNNSAASSCTLIRELDRAAFDGLAIVRLAFSRRARLLICLDAVGRLHLVNPDHMIVIAVCPPPPSSAEGSQTEVMVTDLTVLEDEGSDLVQLMLLTKEAVSGAENLFLEIRQLNLGSWDFKVIFRLAVSPFSHLIAAALGQEVPMLLEGGTFLRNRKCLLFFFARFEILI
jgi:hypothetical protein